MINHLGKSYQASDYAIPNLTPNLISIEFKKVKSHKQILEET